MILGVYESPPDSTSPATPSTLDTTLRTKLGTKRVCFVVWRMVLIHGTPGSYVRVIGDVLARTTPQEKSWTFDKLLFDRLNRVDSRSAVQLLAVLYVAIGTIELLRWYSTDTPGGTYSASYR